jgi:amidohydrolase
MSTRPANPLAAAKEIHDQLVAWRRHLHAHPERSTKEEQTAAFLAAELRKLGYEPEERVGGTFGLLADLRVNGAPAIGLRADMDALPVTEENEVDYASTRPGVMHACGHDAHMAMLLGAAKLLSDRRDQLQRSVRFVFQPSEELFPGGAAPMIEAGALHGVGCMFGLHVWAEMPIGTLGTRVGPFMSSVDDIHIVVRGQGGHAAMPQQCVDPIPIAAEVIQALQTIASRALSMTESAVVSITQLEAGTATNIIPETVRLRGTIRTLSEATRATTRRRVREVADGVARAHGANAEVELSPGYPALVNDESMVKRVLAAAGTLGFAPDQLLDLPPQGGGEDFAYFAQRLPAAFVFVGARNEEKGCCHPHHHPRFNVDEDALSVGAALLTQLSLGFAAS